MQTMVVRLTAHLFGQFDVARHAQSVLYTMKQKGVKRVNSLNVSADKNGLSATADFESDVCVAVKLRKSLSRLGWSVKVPHAEVL
jgi:hypothetical protein